jgi:hypothetical protein
MITRTVVPSATVANDFPSHVLDIFLRIICQGVSELLHSPVSEPLLDIETIL